MPIDVQCYELHGVRIAEFPKDGDRLGTDRLAIEMISEVSVCQPELIVIPTELLGDDFCHLKTRIAGEVLQKFVTYRKRVVILGDISGHLNESSALRDFVYECNVGRDIWFYKNGCQEKKIPREREAAKSFGIQPLCCCAGASRRSGACVIGP